MRGLPSCTISLETLVQCCITPVPGLEPCFAPVPRRSDGPLLRAVRSGCWVLLDELNLAGQSVLEGLNALLDHRRQVFVPELGTTVACAPGFRLFGAQNPLSEGGGRRGLPRSFLNRFSRVRVDLLLEGDLSFIGSESHACAACDVGGLRRAARGIAGVLSFSEDLLWKS